VTGDRKLPLLYIVATSPMVVHFFLRKHIVELSKTFQIRLYLPVSSRDLCEISSLPCEVRAIPIARKISLLWDCITFCGLFFAFITHRPAIVWSVGPKAGLLGTMAALAAGIQHRVFVFQGEVWSNKKGFIRRLLKFCDRLTAMSATHVLAVSQSEKDFLVTENVVSLDHIRVLGSGTICGVDVVRFKPNLAVRAAMRARLGIGDDEVVCIFVGRLNRDKGVLLLAQAFGDCRRKGLPLALIIAGPEEDISHAEISASAGSRDRLFLIGYTDRPEDLMAAADFLCLPSRREGFGMVVLEAAAIGIPAIGSAVYGITDAISQGVTGLLVEDGNTSALCDAIKKLTEDQEMRFRLGKNAYRRVHHDFCSTSVIARYVLYFNNILAPSYQSPRQVSRKGMVLRELR